MMYISQTYVLHHLRVYVGFLDDFLQQRVDEIVEGSVFKASFEAFCQRRPYRQCDDNIVRVLLRSEPKGLVVKKSERLGLMVTYIAESPLLLGVNWLTIALSRSAAILID